MKKISRDPLILFTIGIAVIITNSWHVIKAWMMQPPGTYFTGITHYYADYFLYTSFMAQKTWIITNHLFTNEHLSPTWIYWLYTILGKFGNPFVVYNISVIVFTALLLFLWWILIRRLLPKQPFIQIMAFVFVVSASNFPGLGSFWFSPTPALNRFGGVPHQLFQTILILGVILLAHQKKYILASSVISFLAATANPIQMLLLSIALCFTPKLSLVFVLVPALIGALLTNNAFAHDPILVAAKTWENNQHVLVSLWQFILAMGPVVMFLPLGLKKIIKHLSPLQKTVYIYGGLSVLMFFSPIPTLFGTAPVRWLSPASYSALLIIAAIGLPTSHRLMCSVLISLYIVLSIAAFPSQIEARMHAPQSLQYIPNSVVDNITHQKGDGVVLTDPSVPYDVIIPVMTGRKSFTGHPIHTLYPGTKETLRQRYFSGNMTETEKAQFIIDHNITTIIPGSL